MARHYSNNIIPFKRSLAFTGPLLLATTVVGLSSLFASSYAADLVSGADLLESPLSISLNNLTTQTASHSVALISQTGINNNATITQSADGNNLVNVVQDGSGNEASIEQFGSNNEINLSQYGSLNMAELVQDGNANVINLTQFGSQSFSVHQIGNGMAISVTQL